MPSVENRIVRIEFDNKAFESKIAETITSLGTLDKALALKNGESAFSGITKAADSVNFGGMAAGIENISNKLGAMGAIGFSVIQSLTQSVLGFVRSVGSDILSPILGGGFERAKQIEQAQFMFRGLGVDVEQGMASAKAAVLGTAYSLGEAASAAAQFSAAGINVGSDLTTALRGVAGVAAMTGSSFKDIAYIYSGIAGQGKVNTQDLMQFSTRGLNAAAAMAKSMGTTEQAVRDMVSNGELDFASFAKAMDDAFGAHATQANETFVGALANMKAALARLGAAGITPNMDNLRDVFNALTPTIDKFTAAIRPAIDAFSYLATISVHGLIQGINGINFDSLTKAMPDIVKGMVNIYESIKNIWNIGKQAFQQIFPPDSVSIIEKIASAFEKFTESLHVTVGGMNTIRSLFEGFFSILSIGWTIVKEGVGFLIDLGKALLGIFGPGVVGGLTKISDFFTGLQDSLVKGGGIKSFFDGLEQSLKKPLEALQKIKDAVSDFFSQFTQGAADKVGSSVNGLGDIFDTLKGRLSSVWGPFLDALGTIKDKLEPIARAIEDWFKGLWDALAKGISSGDFNNILDAINTGLLGGIALLLGKFLKGGFNFNLGPGFANLGGTLNAVTNSLSGMQTVLKSDALMKIAEAIGLLAASLLILATIPSEKLTAALGAMSVGFGELIGSFAALEKISSGPTGSLDFFALSAGLVVLAGAMLILAAAVKILSTLDWQGLLKGLAGISGLLLGLSLAVKPLSENSDGMIKAGIGIGLIAASMVVLAAAMKIFATMSWEEIGKGLTGVAVGLGGLVAAVNLMPNELSMVKAGVGILAIATAMVVLAAAMVIFGSMNWETLGKGILGFAVGLGGIVLAINLMPKDSGKAAGSILLVALAVVAISAAMKLISGLSWEEIAKGLTGIAVSLGLLVGASLLMEAGLPGAAAMVIIAAALVVLSDVIIKIGSVSWETLAQGLIGLALAIAIIAGVSLLLIEAVPEIALLGAALILLGAGIALIGGGAYLLAKSFDVLANASINLAKSLPKVLEALTQALPALIKGLAEGLVQLVQVFTDAAPSIAKSIGILVTYILDTLIKIIPKFVEIAGMIIEAILNGIDKYSDRFIAAGFKILIGILNGINDNIETITQIVTSILTKFLDEMSAQIPNMKDSIVNFFVTLIENVAEGLGEIAGTLFVGVAVAFMTGLVTGLDASVGPVISWFGGLIGKVVTWIGDTSTSLIDKGAGFILGLLTGLINTIGQVASWCGSLIGNVVTWIGDTASALIGKGADFILGLLNGLGSAIGQIASFIGAIPGQVLGWIGDVLGLLVGKGSDIIQGLATGLSNRFTSVMNWFQGLGTTISNFFGNALSWLESAGRNIVQGLANGLSGAWHVVTDWVEEKVAELQHKLTHPWELFSPSHWAHRVGNNIMLGFFNGLKEGWENTENWAESIDPDKMFKNLSSKMSDHIRTAVKMLRDLPEFQPIITPVLDLTQLKKDAGDISGIIPSNVVTLTPSASRQYALVIAGSHKTQNEPAKPVETTPKEVTFHQNIYAPKQLSAADIYKYTRNQITIAKEELKIP